MNTKLIALIIITLALAGGYAYINSNSSTAPSNFQYVEGVACHSMGDFYMGDCVFDENGEPIMNNAQERSDEIFSDETSGLPRVVPTETVVLQDGDVYHMTAGLVAQEVGNRTVKRLAYNGMIPGPIIQAPKGAQITLEFTNSLDVETTLHSHGLRGQDVFDGVPTTMGGKQVPMQPGDTFSYTLDFPDTGVFWYHPHIREDYGQELGLYGNFHVVEEGYWNEVDTEEFIVLDDFSEQDPFYVDTTTKALMGRFGNLLMINNQEDYNLTVKTNQSVRFYMTNTANTRTFDIAITGVDMKLVGADIGRVEKERMVESIIIAPAERYVFESRFSKPGVYAITHRGKTMGTITVTQDKVATPKDTSVLRTNTSDYALIRTDLKTHLARPADKKLVIDVDMQGMGGMMGAIGGNMMGHGIGHEGPEGDEGIEWEDEMIMMNESSTEANTSWILRDAQTGKENMDIDWSFEKDDLVKIEIYNDPNSVHPMQHPIHFHGQRFVVISRNGVPAESLQWEDTALIRTGETIEILLNTTNRGTWMTHCHIAEHLGSGMMFNFMVK